MFARERDPVSGEPDPERVPEIKKGHSMRGFSSIIHVNHIEGVNPFGWDGATDGIGDGGQSAVLLLLSFTANFDKDSISQSQLR